MRDWNSSSVIHDHNYWLDIFEAQYVYASMIVQSSVKISEETISIPYRIPVKALMESLWRFKCNPYESINKILIKIYVASLSSVKISVKQLLGFNL